MNFLIQLPRNANFQFSNIFVTITHIEKRIEYNLLNI